MRAHALPPARRVRVDATRRDGARPRFEFSRFVAMPTDDVPFRRRSFSLSIAVNLNRTNSIDA